MNFFKITIAVFVSAIMLTACEKDQDFRSNNNETIPTNSKKSNQNTLKSFGADYWDGLQEFTYNLINAEPLSSIDIEKGLYYTEAALGFQLASIGEKAVQSRVSKEFTYFVSIEDGQTEFTGSELESLNDGIYNEIIYYAEQLAISESDTVTIDVIDLEWNINTSSVIIDVHVLYTVGYLQTIYCIQDDRLAGMREDCSANPKQRSAAELIDAVTRPLSCGTWNNKLNCTLAYFTVNTKNSSISGSDCGANLYVGPAGFCRTSSQSSAEHDEVRYAWNTYCGDITNVNDKLVTVHFEGVFNSGTSFQENKATYYTGKCVPHNSFPNYVLHKVEVEITPPI